MTALDKNKLSMTGFISLLKNNKLFKAVFKLASANAVGQLILLAAMPYLTRIYMPQDFGVFAVFSSLMGMVLVISSLRYELAIPLPKSLKSAHNLLFLALAINVLMTLLTCVIVFWFRFQIAEMTGTPQVANLFWLLPIAVFTGGTYKALTYWALRRKEFGKISQTKILQSCANVATQVIGGLLGAGPLGLAVGQVVGQSAGTTSLLRGVRLGKLWTQGISKRSFILLRRYNNFVKYDCPAAALNTFSAQLPNFALALIFGPVVAGYYYLAERVLWVPLSMVAQSIGQVLISQIREEIEKGSIVKIVVRIFLILSAIGSIIIIPTYFLSETIFKLVFGKQWEVAGSFASILVFGIIVQFIYSPLSMIFLATNSQKTNLLIHLFILIGKLLAFYYAGVEGDPALAIGLLSLTLFLGYGVGMFLVLDNSRKSAGKKCV